MLTAFLGALFGLVTGFRHAFEPDHVAAVSTLLAEKKTTALRVRYALTWGVGHGLTLLVLGGALFALRVSLPAEVQEGLEIAVAMMLVVLGARGLWVAFRPKPKKGAHAVRGIPALLVGLVHGLAGSGAAQAWVMAASPSFVTGLVSLAMYGTGACLGMGLVSAVASWPLSRVARSDRALAHVLGIASVLSIALGIVWGVGAFRNLRG